MLTKNYNNNYYVVFLVIRTDKYIKIKPIKEKQTPTQPVDTHEPP